MSVTTQKRSISFSAPDVGEAEAREAREAILSGWITTGPRTKELERKIAKWIGVEKAACLSSQTACAETALRLLGIGVAAGGSADDEVITCAYTYTASASVIAHVGAKIVLVDCQRDSFLINYDAIEKAITSQTKAIIPVDIGGVVCDYDRLFEIVERKKHLFQPSNSLQKAIGRIAICADAAHAFGSVWHRKMVGSISDFTSFSYHAVKNFTTAEGGGLCWRDIPGISNEEIYYRIQLLSLHGQSKDALAKTQLGAWEYDIKELGYKCNMTDVIAAIGLVQFERYPDLLAERRRTNEAYDAAFKPLGLEVMPHYTDEFTSTGHLYLVRVPGISVKERNEIIIKMAEEEIACNVHYKPLPLMTAFKNLGFDINDYPNSYKRYENVITLANHTLLEKEDVEYVIEKFSEIVKGYLK